MNDPQSLWQHPAVALLGLLAVLFVGVWTVKRVISSIFVLHRQGPKGFLAALDRLFPTRRRAVSPRSAKAIRKALARRLHVPPEMISSDTVRDQLAAYGVSSETIQLLEQILRSEEPAKWQNASSSEMTLGDVWKVSQELDERLPKY